MKNRLIFCAKGVKRSVIYGAKLFWKSLYQNDRFLGNTRPSKLGYFSLKKYFEFIDVNRIVFREKDQEIMEMSEIN